MDGWLEQGSHWLSALMSFGFFIDRIRSAGLDTNFKSITHGNKMFTGTAWLQLYLHQQNFQSYCFRSHYHFKFVTNPFFLKQKSFGLLEAQFPSTQSTIAR